MWDNDTCPDNNIIFHLYTRQNPNTSQKVQSGRDDNSGFGNYDQTRRNKVIIHGFNETIDDIDIVKLKDAYLSHGDYNIWMIDWRFFADVRHNFGEIENVLSRMSHIANCTAELINVINEIVPVGRKTFHIIGIGLGAHIAGYLSEYVKRPYKLARITALDPSLPYMHILSKIARPLYKGDARFVDVLHTNAGFSGYATPLGDVDFYLNGGIFQPGCPKDETLFFGCNHRRALTYFIESISSDVGFYGWHCADYQQYLKNECPVNKPEALMGEYADEKFPRNGVYMVPTKAEPPYAEGPLFLPNQTYTPDPVQKTIHFNVADLTKSLNGIGDNYDEPYDSLDIQLQCYRRQHGFILLKDEWGPFSGISPWEKINCGYTKANFDEY